ncbi:MAG: hypothetical protein M1404_04515 [Acidobacteria bacterium]|nr:hypothetical protein [Acidobacteriota bacterium]
MFLVIETALTLLAVGVTFVYPQLGARGFEFLERGFRKLANRRGLPVAVVGLTALALRAALLPILPIPAPAIHDEFAYLLLSDTFAHGRLTNPSNPMWVHFESFHIIWHPTYTAKYYPAQGLIMALGQVLTGKPFWGVWLSVGLMCAAITWMLQGWLEPGWALLGGFLAVIRFGTFNYWANSYWGGAVAAIGGALVLGALPRLKKHMRVRYALLMGLGFAIIANSRPYEGLFFGIPVAVTLLAWLWKMKRPELGQAMKRAMAPLLAVIALTLVAMGYYFWRTTRSPFDTPYLVYEHRYDPIPNFPWESLKRVPDYRYAAFRTYYLNALPMALYERARTVSGLIANETNNLRWFWAFFLGPVFTLPLLLALALVPYGFSWKDISPGTRFLLLVCGVTLAGETLPIYYQPHYSAPITCAILALVLIAMRSVRPWLWRHKPSGVFLVRAVPSICVLLLLLRIGAGIFGWPPVSTWPSLTITLPSWCSKSPHNVNRAATLRRLRQYPGRQLAIVHYNKDHDVLSNEWVYNRAELNRAKVIWARDMGPAENEKLIRYFKDRHAWLVDADDNPPKLEPYSAAADRQSPLTRRNGP